MGHMNGGNNLPSRDKHYNNDSASSCGQSADECDLFLSNCNFSAVMAYI